MKHIKTFETLFRKKIDSKKEWEDFEKRKANTPPMSIVINGKEIIYNPVGREILNDDNVGKFVVLNDYPFDINDVKLKYRNDLIAFVKSNIGKIIKSTLGGGNAHYDIEYENIPTHLQNTFTTRYYDLNPYYLISSEETIDYISDNYNDCLTYISAKKYNL
jgi:hypothetical protein